MRGRRLRLALVGILAATTVAGIATAAGPSPGPFAQTRRLWVPSVARDGPPPIRTPYPELLPCRDILVPIDKQHWLAEDCGPPDLVPLSGQLVQSGLFLRREAAAAFASLVSAAADDGFRIGASSAYRSYATQETTFESWVSLLGLEQAERTSARAGHSEHQLGTTVDLCAPAGCLEAFSGTPEAAWVALHSWEFGFVVSYPDEKEAVTGYVGEAWHIRYVGVEVARSVRESGLTLHEYLLR